MIPVCQVLDAALHGKSAPDLQPEEWISVYQQLSEHSVYAIPNRMLSGHISDTQLYQDYYSHITRFEQMLVLQQEVIDTLSAQEIPCVILKGLAASALYPEPALRSLGDIDVLVPAGQFARAGASLAAAEFRLQKELDDGEDARYRKHAKYTKYGISIELHIRAFRMADKKARRILYSCMDQGLAAPDALALENYQFPCLPPLQNALEYLCHLRSHILAEGTGLRQLLDWMLFAERYLDDSFYLENLRPILAKVHLDRFAKTVTCVCQDYLGLTKEITWCRDAEAEKAGEYLMKEILSSGNLGRTSPGAANESRVFQRTISEALSLLYEGGLYNFPALKKHSWTRVFAPLAQLGHMMHYLLTGQGNIMESWKMGRRKKKMLRDLGLK